MAQRSTFNTRGVFFNFSKIVSGDLLGFLAKILGSEVEMEVWDLFGLISLNLRSKRSTGHPKKVQHIFKHVTFHEYQHHDY